MDAIRTIDGLAAIFELGEAQAAALERYVAVILAWPGNVTALRSREAIVGTLLGDALALMDAPQLRAAPNKWLDLGAGVGVPGIPLAVARPAADLTLLDSVARKCEFLREAVPAAGLGLRSRVVCERSEEHAATGSPGREAYSVVLARAVAPLPALVELATPLLAPGGILLASKTVGAIREEGSAASVVASLCGLVAGPVIPLPRSPLDGAVCAVFEKVAPTPARLPRRPGIAVKRPLWR
jgi:16S rRNA (guanine527-N7)-methyltransferase